MNWIEIIGHVGAILSSAMFVPQVWKAWKTKSVDDLSLYMILLFFLSALIWITYGTALSLWPVILANGVIMFLCITLFYFKMTFKK